MPMPPPVDDPAWEDWVLGGGVGPWWQPTEQAGPAFFYADQNRPGLASDSQALQEQAEQSVTDMHRHHGHGDYNEAFQAGRRALVCWQVLSDTQAQNQPNPTALPHRRAAPQFAGNAAQRCDVLLTMAAACMEHEQGLEALALMRHAFTLARALALPAELARALTCMAVLHGRLQDPAHGEALALQALSRARERHDHAAVLAALNSLLVVLMQAHRQQDAADDDQSAAATSQRLLRHAHQALAQSPFVPTSGADLELRTHASAALLAGGMGAEALRVLRGCMEAARRQGARVAGLWARLYSAQANGQRPNLPAASTATQLLLAQLRGDDPPRLRLAVATLHAQLALSSGDSQGAHRQRAAVLALQEAQGHHAIAMQANLKHNAEDVLAALPLIEREWLDLGAQAVVKQEDGKLPH